MTQALPSRARKGRGAQDYCIKLRTDIAPCSPTRNSRVGSLASIDPSATGPAARKDVQTTEFYLPLRVSYNQLSRNIALSGTGSEEVTLHFVFLDGAETVTIKFSQAHAYALNLRRETPHDNQFMELTFRGHIAKEIGGHLDDMLRAGERLEQNRPMAGISPSDRARISQTPLLYQYFTCLKNCIEGEIERTWGVTYYHIGRGKHKPFYVRQHDLFRSGGCAFFLAFRMRIFLEKSTLESVIMGLPETLGNALISSVLKANLLDVKDPTGLNHTSTPMALLNLQQKKQLRAYLLEQGGHVVSLDMRRIAELIAMNLGPDNRWSVDDFLACALSSSAMYEKLFARCKGSLQNAVVRIKDGTGNFIEGLREFFTTLNAAVIEDSAAVVKTLRKRAEELAQAGVDPAEELSERASELRAVVNRAEEHIRFCELSLKMIAKSEEETFFANKRTIIEHHFATLIDSASVRYGSGIQKMSDKKSKQLRAAREKARHTEEKLRADCASEIQGLEQKYEVSKGEELLVIIGIFVEIGTYLESNSQDVSAGIRKLLHKESNTPHGEKADDAVSAATLKARWVAQYIISMNLMREGGDNLLRPMIEAALNGGAGFIRSPLHFAKSLKLAERLVGNLTEVVLRVLSIDQRYLIPGPDGKIRHRAQDSVFSMAISDVTYAEVISALNIIMDDDLLESIEGFDNSRALLEEVQKGFLDKISAGVIARNDPMKLSPGSKEIIILNRVQRLIMAVVKERRGAGSISAFKATECRAQEALSLELLTYYRGGRLGSDLDMDKVLALLCRSTDVGRLDTDLMALSPESFGVMVEALTDKRRSMWKAFDLEDSRVREFATEVPTELVGDFINWVRNLNSISEAHKEEVVNFMRLRFQKSAVSQMRDVVSTQLGVWSLRLVDSLYSIKLLKKALESEIDNLKRDVDAKSARIQAECVFNCSKISEDPTWLKSREDNRLARERDMETLNQEREKSLKELEAQKKSGVKKTSDGKVEEMTKLLNSAREAARVVKTQLGDCEAALRRFGEAPREITCATLGDVIRETFVDFAIIHNQGTWKIEFFGDMVDIWGSFRGDRIYRSSVECSALPRSYELYVRHVPPAHGRKGVGTLELDVDFSLFRQILPGFMRTMVESWGYTRRILVAVSDRGDIAEINSLLAELLVQAERGQGDQLDKKGKRVMKDLFRILEKHQSQIEEGGSNLKNGQRDSSQNAHARTQVPLTSSLSDFILETDTPRSRGGVG